MNLLNASKSSTADLEWRSSDELLGQLGHNIVLRRNPYVNGGRVPVGFSDWRRLLVADKRTGSVEWQVLAGAGFNTQPASLIAAFRFPYLVKDKFAGQWEDVVEYIIVGVSVGALLADPPSDDAAWDDFDPEFSLDRLGRFAVKTLANDMSTGIEYRIRAKVTGNTLIPAAEVQKGVLSNGAQTSDLARWRIRGNWVNLECLAKVECYLKRKDNNRYHAGLIYVGYEGGGAY